MGACRAHKICLAFRWPHAEELPLQFKHVALLWPDFVLLYFGCSRLAQNRKNLSHDLSGGINPFRFGYILHVEYVCIFIVIL